MFSLSLSVLNVDSSEAIRTLSLMVTMDALGSLISRQYPRYTHTWLSCLGDSYGKEQKILRTPAVSRAFTLIVL